MNANEIGEKPGRAQDMPPQTRFTETRLQSARRLVLEGKSDVEVMRITELSPVQLGQVKRRINEDARRRESQESERNDREAAARVDGIAAPVTEPSEQHAEEAEKIQAAAMSGTVNAVDTITDGDASRPAAEDLANDLPFASLPMPLASPQPEHTELPIQLADDPPPATPSAWNSHICPEMPREYRVYRGDDSEAWIITDSMLKIGPILFCPWCGAPL